MNHLKKRFWILYLLTFEFVVKSIYEIRLTK